MGNINQCSCSSVGGYIELVQYVCFLRITSTTVMKLLLLSHYIIKCEHSHNPRMSWVVAYWTPFIWLVSIVAPRLMQVMFSCIFCHITGDNIESDHLLHNLSLTCCMIWCVIHRSGLITTASSHMPQWPLMNESQAKLLESTQTLLSLWSHS